MSTPIVPLQQHITRIIASRSSTAISADTLSQALYDPPDLDSLLDLAQFDPSTYVRVPLFRTEEFEVRLLCWSPGQSSALHGHGGSACAFRVLQGEATELRLHGEQTRLLRGDVAVAADDGIHQVSNLGDQPLISLHLYAPPLPVDQPSLPEGRRIVIIGGGFCGTALVIHLLRLNDRRLRLTLVEPSTRVGRGVAFGTSRIEHSLNVPASAMSLDPTDPNDFLRFARQRLGEVPPNALLPRALYGEYMQTRLDEAIQASTARLRIVRSPAEALREATRGWSVQVADGRVLPADEVVLATGHGPGRIPTAFEALLGHPAIVANPWLEGALDDVQSEERVLLVGTGLTAVDVHSTLRARGLRAPIHALSRNGRWPRPHLPGIRWEGTPVSINFDEAPVTADSLAVWLRAQIDIHAARDIPWQAVMDEVRRNVQAIWTRMSISEQSVFLRKYRPMWEVHRHRLDSALWKNIQVEAESGALITYASSIYRIEANGPGLRVTHRADKVDAVLDVDRVVLCCGNESDPLLMGSPLWEQMIDERLVSADIHGLGVETDDKGQPLRNHPGGLLGTLPDPEGKPPRTSDGLWALGGLLRPIWFESTAVPELSRQVRDLAARLENRARAPGTAA